MSKRTLSLLAVLCLLLSLAACGSTQTLSTDDYLTQVDGLHVASEDFVSLLEDYTSALLSSGADLSALSDALSATAQPFLDFAALEEKTIPADYRAVHPALAQAARDWGEYVPEYVAALDAMAAGTADVAAYTATVSRCTPLRDALTLAFQAVEAVEVPS